MPKKIIVVTGPTAIGKTDEAIRLASAYGCPIISADSRQVFRELNIGVARPDPEQLAAVPHFLIAHTSIHQTYNAGIYASEARKLVNDLLDVHEHLIVCGGTGLYIQALLKGLDPRPGRNEALRNELEQLMQAEGIEALQQRLERLDKDAHQSIDLQNPQRLMRAIEIAASPAPESSGLPDFRHAFQTETIVMTMDRDTLYDRINRRVDLMVEAGLEQEVASLQEWRDLNALQTVGYNEWWPYFDGQVSRAEAIDKIKQHSRNYAKRQMTWMRHRM